MNIKGNTSRNTVFIISALAVLFFAFLAYLFPYSGDDWAWGSYIGIERLKSYFVDYNGRYLGNLLVLVITRSKFLDVIAMAVSYYLSCFLCYKYSKNSKAATLIFAIFLFLMMPKNIFTQTIVWTSGYSNYVPSALMSVMYITIVRNITGSEKPTYKKPVFAVTFLLGFCSALFMENITLFNLCLGAAVILYTLIRFKKLYLTHFAFLGGAVAGAVLMFTNSAYGLITSGNDEYRNTASGADEMIYVAKDHAHKLFGYIVTSNWLMCLVVTVLLCALLIKFLKKSENKAANVISVCSLLVNCISLFFIICSNVSKYYTNPFFSFDFLGTRRGVAAVCILYGLSICLTVLMCVKKGRKFRMLLPFYCVPVVIAPLLFVNPIGERCLFIAYLLLMVFAADLFSYVTEDISVASVDYKALFVGFGAAVVLQAIVYAGIFLPVYKTDSMRNDFAKIQAENGEKTILTCALPNQEFLWTSSPAGEPWCERYKIFHGLPLDVEFVFLTPEDLQAAYDNYDK